MLVLPVAAAKIVAVREVTFIDPAQLPYFGFVGCAHLQGLLSMMWIFLQTNFGVSPKIHN
jgi:hypothetical protein